MERLEERVVLSTTTLTWTGADASAATPNDNWSDGNNWSGGVAPVTGDNLVFPAGLSGAALTSNDDITDGSFGSLTIQGSGYTITGSTDITATLTGALDDSPTSGVTTFNLPVDFGAAQGTVTVANSAATLTIGAAIAGTGGLSKQGAGVLDLTAANTFTGTTTVAAGTLLVDGSGTVGAVAVQSGGTLGGTGTVASIASTAGVVSPGDSSTTTGVLTDSGTVSLDGSSNFDVTINGETAGTDYDQLDAGGAVSLNNAVLNVSLGSFTPTAGQTFTILNNTSGQAISGTFNGLPEGATVAASGQLFTISYDGGSNNQSVVLTAVSPTTDTWTGADSTSSTPGNWSDPNNWSGHAAPAAGDTVVFPSGLSGAALTSNDDLSGVTLGSILIEGSGYTITGSSGITQSLTGAIDASQSSGSTSFDIPIAFGSATGAITVDNQAGGLVMGGVISGSGGLIKQGAGVLDLQATNTYTGTTTVGAGALLVDGSISAVAVNPGATVGGSGTVASIASTAGAVSPGDSTTNTGTLTDSGALSLDGSSTFDVAINGQTASTTYDQLVAGGAINLTGATLSVTTGSFNPTPGQTFTIIHNTSGQAITGTFNGLPEGATLTADGHDFAISYVGNGANDVVLTAVNPPTVIWSGTDALSSINPNDNWSDPNNWQGDAAPVAGDTIEFPSGLSGAALTSNNDIANTTFNSLNIEEGGYTINGDSIGLAGSIDATINTSATSTTSTVALGITFNPGAGNVTVENSGTTLLLSGPVVASSGLTKEGSGTLSLTNNDGTSPAVVDAGTLLVDGSIGDVSVNSGGTIGGKGTVGEITTVSGTVSPGDSSTLTGTLTDDGDIVLDSNSTFAVTLNGTTAGATYDQIAVPTSGKTINLANATLDVTLGSSFTNTGGQQYTIISNGTGSAVTGTFAGLAEGATVTVGSDQFAISYKGGTDSEDVVLTSLLSTTTTVSPVTTPLVAGQSVTLTARVAPGSGTGTPTGTVTFYNGTTSLGTGTLNSDDTATLTTSKLTAGSDQITATYSGDSTYGTSTSPAVTVTVSQASTTTTLTTSPNPSVAGNLVTLLATISPVAPGSGSPTGTVQFYNGSTALGSAVSVTGGTAVLSTALPVGTDSLTAVYSGDTNFTTSTSAAVSQVVTSATATVTVSTSNPNPFALQPVTLTAIVSTATGSGTPTGTVTFEAGGTPIGTATLNNGQATLTTSAIPIGQDAITVAYSGDSNFQATTSPVLSMVVGHSSDLYINQIYKDVFGIPAGQYSTYWIALLNSGYSRKFVTRQILQSKYAKAAAIEHTYVSVLDRQPTPKELRRAERSGQTSTTPLAIRLFGSAEFYQTQGHGTTDGFLTALAQDWFGAPFPATVQARLAGQLAHGTSRTKVAREVINSPSGVDAQVNTIVESVLGRPATAKDDRQLAPLVRQGNQIAVYETLFTSREFITKYVALT